MYSQVKIQPLKNNKFRILEDIVYKDIKIPKDYITNGADVPRIFWSFIPPNKSDFLPAVIVHDFLCDKEEYKKADEYFEECLEVLGIEKLDKYLLVKSVRIYHKFMNLIKKKGY
jgi:uncharacterized UPF0160 family protein